MSSHKEWSRVGDRGVASLLWEYPQPCLIRLGDVSVNYHRILIYLIYLNHHALKGLS